MEQSLRSILIGTSGLWLAGLAALLLTIYRKPAEGDTHERERAVCLLMVALAAQCLHFAEEFLTRFELRFPTLLELAPWSQNFFVTFNLVWLSIWILSALGLLRGSRLSLLPICFFTLASIMNGIGHPILSIVVGGYFPGLFTSPVVGIMGILLLRSVLNFTRPAG